MKKSLLSTLTLLLVVGFYSTLNAQTRVTITDDDLVGNTTYNWSADTV